MGLLSSGFNWFSSYLHGRSPTLLSRRVCYWLYARCALNPANVRESSEPSDDILGSLYRVATAVIVLLQSLAPISAGSLWNALLKGHIDQRWPLGMFLA